MTAFPETAQRVADRIRSAPVEEWLKREALNDLNRLADAHNAGIEEFEKTIAELKKSDNMKSPEIGQAPVDETWLRRDALDIAARVFPLVPVPERNFIEFGEEILSFLKGNR